MALEENIFMSLILKLGKSFLVILVGVILYKLAIIFIKKTLARLKSQRKLETMSTVLNSVIKYLIIFFVACEIFYFFGIDIKSILTIAGIGGITIGLGAQGLVKDFITGIFILFEDPFSVGDEVIIGDKSGVVKAITLRIVILETEEGFLHIIPNSEIKIITNKKNKKINRRTKKSVGHIIKIRREKVIKNKFIRRIFI